MPVSLGQPEQTNQKEKTVVGNVTLHMPGNIQTDFQLRQTRLLGKTKSKSDEHISKYHLCLKQEQQLYESFD